MKTASISMIPLTQAALRLRVSYLVARDLVLRGMLAGRQDGRFWFVESDSLDTLVAQREGAAQAEGV